VNIDDYKTIYSLMVSDCTEEQHMMEDIPHEYRITEWEYGKPGIMVWGRFKDRWYPNPSTRYLISVLIRCLNADQ
jgi:hypothetical protein